MRLLHLDAGRKFFGLPALKKILDNMDRCGFTHLELYFSDNQGFRFALEDMVLTTRFGSYDLAPALGDGYCEGPKSPSGCGGWLTTVDMEAVLGYARERGIEIIPLLNMPGHMGCILELFPHLRYQNSKSSIDLANDEAVEFALALLTKYVDYFAASGCGFFHIGADEWANDIAPGYPDEIVMGFDRIYRQGGMEHFVRFINAASRIVKDRGLVPMAFNDAVCYANDVSTYGRIDGDLVLAYWSKGWDGYDLAAAELLRDQGYRLINANRMLYCGMGCQDWPGRVRAAEAFDPRVFDPDGYVEKPLGAMLCFWSDRGSFDGPDDGAAAAEHLIPVMEAFGASMDRFEA